MAETGIKTGSPGFDIEDTAYTYDVGAEEQITTPTDQGDMTVDKTEGKDISKGTKQTLADFLYSATKQNRYPIGLSGEDYKESSTKTADGSLPAPLARSTNPTQYTAENENITGTRPSASDPSTKLQGKFIKGKQAPYPQVDPPEDGNLLLKNAAKDTSPIRDYQSAVLATNRFSPYKPAPNDMAAISVTDIFMLDNSTYLAQRDPPRSYNPVMHHPRYGDISMNRLATIGATLSIRASQELTAATDGIDPNGTGTEAAALLPGGVQLGATRVDTFILEAQDILRGGITEEEVNDDSMLHIGNESWGSLNNVLDQYSGITALGMPILSIALTAATVLVFELFGTIISAVSGPGKPIQKKGPDGRYFLGRSTYLEMPDPDAFPPIPLDFGALLGVRPTVHPFGDCLQLGTLTFFGIDASGGIGGAILSTLMESIENPGFNVGIARTIIRSGVLIVDAFGKAFNSPNVIAGIKNVLSIIDELRTSKFVAAMNVFSRLGDMILTNKARAETYAEVASAFTGKTSQIDRTHDDDSIASVSKNRLSNSVKLAWSSNRAYSLYLLPTAVHNAAATTQLGGFNSGYGMADKKTSRSIYAPMKLTETRIPTEYVAQLEAVLEGEYMPFYFHDLRTNEIISFHAFLSALTDDYSASWESVEGMGRVEPIKTYKNTQRKLSLTFHVVATSEEDFNEMWVKLNKLVTLVYPQYTRGRMRETENASGGQYAFIQPFSQIPAVSPLIRLRLGDLFHSNYSRFALARLFGIGTDAGVKLNSEGIVPPSGFTEEVQKVYDQYRSSGTGTWFILGNGYPAVDQGSFPTLPSITANTATSYAVPPTQEGQIPVKIISAEGDNIVFEPRMPTANDLEDVSTTNVTLVIDNIDKACNNSNDPEHYVIGGRYVAMATHLMPSKKTLAEIFTKARSQSSTTTVPTDKAITEISNFMDPEKNALVKSFQSAGGKGLAGIIETMSFNWFENTTWETKSGLKAPKRCQVSISFAPIHDISPGLDHLGYNRAPVYPVGWMRNGRDDS